MKLWESISNLQIFKALRLKYGSKILIEGADKRNTELSTTELAVLDVTAGTVTASKALVVNSSSNLASGLVGFTGATLETEAGAGITGGTGTVYKTAVDKVGGLWRTTIMIDLTGLASSTTDLDIIGQGASAAHIGRLTAARNGNTILAVRMECLEAPAGGVADIDLYSATEATGVFDAAISSLAETALITAGGSWTNGAMKGATTAPLAGEYLYLTGGAGGTAATYTAGKFLITIFGY